MFTVETLFPFIESKRNFDQLFEMLLGSFEETNQDELWYTDTITRFHFNKRVSGSSECPIRVLKLGLTCFPD